ncbi:MAG: Trm112 family protein [Phycisphaerae bacterium]
MSDEAASDKPSDTPENPGTPASEADDMFTQTLRMLRCPLTLSPLRHEGDELIAETGGLRYPIRDGIPVMLPEEATLPQGVASLEEFRSKFGIQR